MRVEFVQIVSCWEEAHTEFLPTVRCAVSADLDLCSNFTVRCRAQPSETWLPPSSNAKYIFQVKYEKLRSVTRRVVLMTVLTRCAIKGSDKFYFNMNIKYSQPNCLIHIGGPLLYHEVISSKGVGI